MGILSEENRAALLTYKYKGGDTSYIYAHVLSPIAQLCVDHTPVWIAPNAITLSGLCLPLSMTLLSIIYNPTLGVNGPNWLALGAGLSLLIYQTMDNMDGKQARKIGASSPLGMLFDHVCDAINSGTSSIFMGSLFGAGWEWTFWFCILAFVPFHMQTWEEYYRREMVLPVINGPSEGILLLVGLAFLTFFKGSAWWQQEMQWSDSIVQVFPAISQLDTIFKAAFSFFFLFALCTVLTNSLTVIKIVFTEKGSFLKTFTSLLPFIAFIVSTAVWKIHSTIVHEHPLVSVILIIAVFVEGVSHVMLSHIVEDKLKPFERVISWMMIGMALNVCFTPYGQPIVDEMLLLIPYFFIAVSVTTISLVMICQESADALDIYVFRVGKPSAKKNM